MARTAVELPDPLENAAGGGGPMGSTDDLLAQLAGDEVDRLLSEADAAPPDPRHADRAAGAMVEEPAEAAGVVDDGAGQAATREAMDALLDDLGGTEAPADGVALNQVVAATTAEAPDSRSPQQILEQRADELVVQAKREAEAAQAAAQVPPSAADALAAEMEADEAAHAAALRRIEAGEVEAPTSDATIAATPPIAPVTEPASTVGPQPVSATAEVVPVGEANTTIAESDVDFARPEEDAVGRVPLLVRVLEWMNAPLAGLSASLREAMGEVAIVTSVNAVAIFIYVLIARRH
jgi:hypothetical protein